MQAFNDSFHIDRGNGKAVLCTPYRRVGGNGGIFPLFLNLGKRRGGWSASCPGHFSPVPLTRRLGEPHVRSEHFAHMHLCTCQEVNHDSSDVQPTAYSLQSTLHPPISLDFLYPFQCNIYSHPTAYCQFTVGVLTASFTELQRATMKCQFYVISVSEFVTPLSSKFSSTCYNYMIFQ